MSIVKDVWTFAAFNKYFTARVEKTAFGWQVIVGDEVTDFWWSTTQDLRATRKVLAEKVHQFQNDAYWRDILASRLG
jgi:hypothetical protein